MRHSFLLLMLSSMHGFAAEPWAYCDANNKAYRTVQRFGRDCPRESSRPGGPARHHRPVDPESCRDRSFTASVKHPELDYICAYPTAYETGDAATRNTNRCVNADAKYCQLGAGGVEGPGEHSIPGDAWYHIRGSTQAFPDVKCQCGCFVAETLIATASGYPSIAALATEARRLPVTVFQFSKSKGRSLSQPLRGNDFTVGPEAKPVIRMASSSGAELAVTTMHPILVQRGAALVMIQAQDVELGDLLLDENGHTDPVLSLDSYFLTDVTNKVYNLDTLSRDPEEHVISANRIQVGDLYWQRRLSEQSARAQNLLKSSQDM